MNERIPHTDYTKRIVFLEVDTDTVHHSAVLKSFLDHDDRAILQAAHAAGFPGAVMVRTESENHGSDPRTAAQRYADEDAADLLATQECAR